MTVQPVVAQSYQEQRPREQVQRDQSSPSSNSSSDLPDWAEPAQPQTESPSKEGASAMAPPNPPDDPQQVPVDGGLALLAAAGAGYAVRKLNEDDEAPVA